jgi:hypothetical protein
MHKYKDAKSVQQDLPYSSRRVYLPVRMEEDKEVLVHSKVVYWRDPVTGALRRVNKAESKKKEKT